MLNAYLVILAIVGAGRLAELLMRGIDFLIERGLRRE